MQWLSTPPCESMEIKASDDVKGRLDLVAKGLERKIAGGATAAIGGFFAANALKAVRIVPGPAKLIPLAIAAVGAGVGAIGAFGMISEHSVTIERGRGVRFRWKPGPLEPREVFVPAAEIAAFEIVRDVHRHESDCGGTSYSTSFPLMLVTRSGDAHPVDLFRTYAQADIRKTRIEALLAGGKPSARRTQG